jgi:hypothetical protein
MQPRSDAILNAGAQIEIEHALRFEAPATVAAVSSTSDGSRYSISTLIDS